MAKIAIAVHGGAGAISGEALGKEKEKAFKDALKKAVTKGYEVLKSGKFANEAVISAVKELEDNELFNAGKGSVFNSDGRIEMDASIMDGFTGKAGAVAGIRNVKNPVLLANLVKDKTNHVLLFGKGAEELAKKHNIPFESENYFFSSERFRQWQKASEEHKIFLDHSARDKFGTVGAVAIDTNGNLAAATSTGGMTNKMYGRVGDSPIIGAGVFAKNETCAISCTGHGEYFLRNVVAYDISCLMEYKGLSLKEACESVVMEKLKNQGGEGGLIAVDRESNIELIFNTQGMYRAKMREGENAEAFIW